VSTGALIGIVIAIIVVAAIAVVTTNELRRARLRRQFGPEYTRLAEELGSKRKAEAELLARQRKAAKLDVRPLSPEQQAQYAADWNGIQEQFVDSPTSAVTAAQRLIARIMRDRGYPEGEREETIVYLSVHHSGALDDYRQARDINDRVDSATTEDLRNALIWYRTLFDDLTGATRRDGRTPSRRALARTASSNTEEG
jgi:hypothetical protein